MVRRAEPGIPLEFAPLPREFYEPSSEQVAANLLGHRLIRRTPQGICGGAIVETEAYSEDDPAAHSFVGETPRNRAMFGPPGHAYVYFIYGNHWCLNAVCRPAGRAEAVLIRALEVEFGEALMRERRPAKRVQDLTNGPAKLCEALDIDRRFDGADLCASDAELLIARNPERERFVRERGGVVRTTRIGITKAADRPLRFVLAGSLFLSRRLAGAAGR